MSSGWSTSKKQSKMLSIDVPKPGIHIVLQLSWLVMWQNVARLKLGGVNIVLQLSWLVMWHNVTRLILGGVKGGSSFNSQEVCHSHTLVLNAF